MEHRNQLNKWAEQLEAADMDAVADMDVAARLLNHGIEALDKLEAAEAKLRELEMQNQKFPDSALCAAGVEPCVCAVANNLDAARYRALRNQDIESNFPRSGVFIGKVPENHCLTGIDADNAVDSLFPAPKQEEK